MADQGGFQASGPDPTKRHELSGAMGLVVVLMMKYGCKELVVNKTDFANAKKNKVRIVKSPNHIKLILE